MEDPVSLSFQTFDRLAEAALQAGEDAPSDQGRERVEAFLMRTGRPVPKIVVLGRNLALRCRQIDELGQPSSGQRT